MVIINIQHCAAVSFDHGGRRLLLQVEPSITVVRLVCIGYRYRVANRAGTRNTFHIGIISPSLVLLPVEYPILSRSIVCPSGIQCRIRAQIELATRNIDTRIVSADNQTAICIGDLRAIADSASVYCTGKPSGKGFPAHRCGRQAIKIIAFI